MLPDILKNKEITISQDDAFVLNLISQSQQTSQLVKMRKLEESKIPAGTLAVARTLSDVISRIDLHPFWISFSLVNDGPGAIAASVNSEVDLLSDSGTIALNETYNVDMTYPVIRAICLKAAAGSTASVRIYGKVGSQ